MAPAALCEATDGTNRISAESWLTNPDSRDRWRVSGDRQGQAAALDLFENSLPRSPAPEPGDLAGPRLPLLAFAGRTAPVPVAAAPAPPPGAIRDGRPIHATGHGAADFDHGTLRRVRATVFRTGPVPRRFAVGAVVLRTHRGQDPCGSREVPTRPTGSAGCQPREVGEGPGRGRVRGHSA